MIPRRHFVNLDVALRVTQLGALLLEQNEKWAVEHARCKTLETISQMIDDPLVSLPAVAR